MGKLRLGRPGAGVVSASCRVCSSVRAASIALAITLAIACMKDILTA